MAFQPISLSQEALLLALQQAVQPLLYPSETDAPIEVQILPAESVFDNFTMDEIERSLYTAQGRRLPVSHQRAEFNRSDSTGTLNFFRDRLEVISTAPNNEITYHEVVHREQAPLWRRLRDLIFDNLVNGRWFKTDLSGSDAARKDIYVVGQHVQIEVDPETNEMRTSLGNWFVLSTYAIET